ncbi:DNA-binding domain-containing protein [Artemisia annua]|uniref:DNA-binding domain-containing protein n=1 Tax=Artemisia annua TaxID=35608 RepID=A0A2U1PYW4_ARTAN|nr:DNA-binding domain-containing protein [Artemisia annua]
MQTFLVLQLFLFSSHERRLNQLKASAINGNTAQLLQAKLQGMSKTGNDLAPLEPEVNLPEKDVTFESGPVMLSDDVVVEEVQLSNMPSLDMEMIWDSLLVSD